MESKGQALYRRAKRLIPGGTQLVSKRAEMLLPEGWPSYYLRAKGAEVWDLDGNRYIDMSYMGIGACPLGYADPDVDAAVKEAIAAGSMCTLNCPEEVELAEVLLELHPWADMARFARTGGEAMAVAVRIARARTGRDKIAFCGYHGWHDWYLAANLGGDVLGGHLLPGLEPSGVPSCLAGTAFAFHYNHIEELEEIARQHKRELAAVVIEPVRDKDPLPGFLEGVKEIARNAGAVLIFDEVSSGFRLTAGGAHLVYGVTPDVAVFAKGISNGYPMAAIIGRGDVMQAARGSFISSTYWTERLGPAAALATVKKYRRHNVPARLIATGQKIQDGWRQAAAQTGLKVNISGIPPLAHLSFDYSNAQAIKTLFTKQMLERGFLAGGAFYASFAHQESHIRDYIEAAAESFAVIRRAIDDEAVEKRLGGPAAHTGFYRLT